MRIVLPLILLLPIFAHSVELTAELCPANGSFYVQGGCPADLTTPQAGGSVTDTTASGSVVCNGANCIGTVHAYARAASAGTPSYADCVSGAGSLNKQTDAITVPGTSNFSFINLTSDTSIRITYCFEPIGGNYDNRNYDDIAVAADFQTLAGAPGSGNDIENSGFFVCPTGNNNNNGTSTSTPWETLSKVNSTVTAVGSKVWLCRGGVWNGEKLTIDWNGEPDGSEDAFVGCYYNDAGNGNQATECDDGTDPIVVGDADMPEIRGTLTDACIQAWNCDYTSNLGGPSSHTDGQIVVLADYVTVKNLQVSYTKARGFKVKGRDQVDDEATNVAFIDNYFHHIGGHMLFERGHTGAIIKGNLVRYWGTCEDQDRNGSDPLLLPNQDNCGQFGVPGGLSINRGSHALVEGNVMEFGWGECFNLLSSENLIFRNNFCGNPASGGYYCDSCQNAVIEHNISVGSQTEQCGVNPGNCGQWRGAGITTNIENSATDRDLGPTLTRNNISVAAVEMFNTGMSSNAINNGRRVQHEVYGNTFVRAKTWGNRFVSTQIANRADNYQVRSNIFWDQDLSADAICRNMTSNSAIQFDYNGWFETIPSNVHCDAETSDVRDPNNGPAGFSPYDDFKLMDADNKPVPADVKPTGSIPGDASLNSSNHNLDFDTFFTQRQWDNMEKIGVCNDTKANWNLKLNCYEGGEARGGAPTAGAVSP